MIVTVEGDLRGSKAMMVKDKDGKFIPQLDRAGRKLFIHRVELAATEFGLPEPLDIVSSKDGKKKGPISIRVELRLDRDKEGKVTGKFRAWEI